MNSAETYRTYRITPRPGYSPYRAAVGWVFTAVTLARRERRGHCPKPLREHLRGWSRGFFGPSYTLYQLQTNDPRDYLSDYEVLLRSPAVNDPFNPVVRNKLALSRTLSLHGFRTPQVYALLDRGLVRAMDGTSAVSPPLDWLESRLQPGGCFVVKPAAEGQGRGIMFVGRDGEGFVVNAVRASRDDLAALLVPLRAYLITEFVVQAPYAAAVYAGATNTVRVLTLWDLETSRPFIAAAAHRFGSERSGPVDNFHGGLGGLSASIDVETGVLGPGAMVDADGRLVWRERHPGTGAPIAGVRVERWEETLATLLAIAARFPEAPAVGWDLVVTRDGCCVLEGNSPPQVAVWQVHRPLLPDPRVRRFYEAYGVLRRPR